MGANMASASKESDCSGRASFLAGPARARRRHERLRPYGVQPALRLMRGMRCRISLGIVSDEAKADLRLPGVVRVSVLRVHIVWVHMAVQQPDRLHHQRTEPQRHGEGHTGPSCRLHAGCVEGVGVKPLA